jgi:hypothetical protein
MDYTTVERVKNAMHSNPDDLPDGSPALDDPMLAVAVAAASRAIDRKCTGVPDNAAVDYFKLETVTDEVIVGQVNNKGIVSCYPHKPIIESLTAFDYAISPIEPWINVDASRVQVSGPRVEAWPVVRNWYPMRCRVKVTYTGGLAEDVSHLPEDLVEIATILAIRFYREAETGMTDAIGVAELGSMIYTKAWPVRALDMIQPFIRRVAWRNIS